MSSDGSDVRHLQSRIRRLRNLLFSVAAGEDQRAHAFEPAADDFGKLEGTLLAFVDEFLAAKRRARDLEARNAAVIAAQADLIDTLGAPIIEVSEGVVVMPVIGPLTRTRLAKTTEQLLERIVRMRVGAVIVDLSGVDDIDTANAAQLDALCRAVKLLGARSIFTGIRPDLAGMLAALGIEFDALTARTLREGLRLVA